MTTLPIHDPHPAPAPAGTVVQWQDYKAAHHYRNKEEEFDGVKLGMWLFLATEVLLFSGLFCAYTIFRILHPQAFANGSSYLDWRWGGLNTVVLLVSSYTMAASIRNVQLQQFARAKFNLIFTMVSGLAFLFIKFTFEYTPKWSGYFFFLDPALSHHTDSGKRALGGLFHFVEGYGGKRPGELFNYPFSTDPYEHLWWSVYYCATGIHASHVIIGMALIYWVYRRVSKGVYGPTHYTGVEMAGLYWHLVDLIWIFLFPLLYLIH